VRVAREIGWQTRALIAAALAVAACAAPAAPPWAELGSADPPPAPPATVPVQGSAPASIHVVRSGETLTRIAAAYSVDVDRIALANDLHDADRIRAGQSLRIPAPSEAVRPEALVEEASQAYRNARFEIAIARAQTAEAILDAGDDSGDPLRHALRARAAFIAGCATAAFGDDERAVAAFARVRSFDPDFTPPDGWLSPRLEKLYLAASGE
jgi:LysM repeat protein